MLELRSPADVAVRPFLASRRTRNRVSDVDRARLVAWYVGAVAGGDRNPARTLAERYADSSYKTWANVFSQARSRDPALLTESPRRGVAGGVLTDHAEHLLNASLPASLEEDYQKERRVESGPVSFRDRRTYMPGRSEFVTDFEYELAFRLWSSRGEWFRVVEAGPEKVEGREDWLIRMTEAG